MNNVVSCISPVHDRRDCPYLKTCIARLNDKSIVGCGMPLYQAGIIPYEAIMVEHRIGEENTNADSKD